MKANFCAGPAIFIYGHTGPAYGWYEVEIDSVSTTASAYLANNGSAPSLMFGKTNLSYGTHSLVLRNLGTINGNGGTSLLFDYLHTTVQVAPAG
jgi:hypothetical protein